MKTEFIIVTTLLILFVIGFVAYIIFRHRKFNSTEIKQQDVATMAEYIRTQKEKSELIEQAKIDRKQLMTQQLDTFKKTKEHLMLRLKSQMNAREWKPLESILKNADKGGVGIYILYNETKNKYYVGQAKQILKRIRDHFVVEDIAIDHMKGDRIHVKYLTANEFDAEYRLDHIEKTTIEIFDADKTGYNKSTGNVN